MTDVIAVSLAFPTVMFTFCLVVVLLYWAVVLIGVAEVDVLDTVDGGEAGVAGALLPATRAGRDVPVTIVLSLWIILSWCASTAFSLIAARIGFVDGLGVLRDLLVLLLASSLAWVATVLLVLPLGRLYHSDDADSHRDFVGRYCVIRTAAVSADFGQAEITAADGSTAIVQVRLGESIGDGTESLTRGASALIFDYDPAGGHFYVTSFGPFDSR